MPRTLLHWTDCARERFTLDEEERAVAAERRARASGLEFVVPDRNEKLQHARHAGLTLQDLTAMIHKKPTKAAERILDFSDPGSTNVG